MAGLSVTPMEGMHLAETHCPCVRGSLPPLVWLGLRAGTVRRQVVSLWATLTVAEIRGGRVDLRPTYPISGNFSASS